MSPWALCSPAASTRHRWPVGGGGGRRRSPGGDQARPPAAGAPAILVHLTYLKAANSRRWLITWAP